MTIIKLAWRNIWRHKRRTLLLIAVVAYATLSTVFFWAMTEGQNDSIIANQARFIQAPALITTPSYHEDPDPENALPTLDFMAVVRNVAGVREVAPRVDAFGVIRSAYRSENVLLRGIAPQLEPAVSNIPSKIAEGVMLEHSGQVVLGVKLAQDLDVRLGERIAVDVSSLAGAQSLGLRLVGTTRTGVANLDRNTVYVHIEDARTLTGVSTATAVALDIARGNEERVSLQQVAPLLADKNDVTIYSLNTLMGDLVEFIQANTAQMLPILILFAIFAALAVTATLIVSLIERQREFGMMAAIGLAPRNLALMVILEAILTSVIGWLIGLALGYGISYIFSIYNILGSFFASSIESFASFGMGEELYTSIKVRYALYAALTVAFAAIFALIFPARQLLKLNPADAMRE